MGSETYPLSALVLRNTKVGETDLIVTLLAEDGRQVRAVAKGARKPRSSFAARLDLFAQVDLLLVSGKSLDIVKEARLVDAHRQVSADMEHAAAAAVVADLACKITQQDMAFDRLYDLSCSALSSIGYSSVPDAVAVCAAYLLKSFAFAGLRPQLRMCASCGSPLDYGHMAPRQDVAFSVSEGGVICPSCLMYAQTSRVAAEVLRWADFLLHSTFADIVSAQVPERISFEILHLCQSWCVSHVSSRLKSLEFMFNCGLY